MKRSAPKTKESTGELIEEEQKSFEGCLKPGGITQEDALNFN